ncbi:hypothetical protein [Persicobacter psychrovividus]|uniref:Calx-beta domain-containing protein n=1 Tax=Persicobacter psychrovividus TaxID=387638 RepID=A0ABM7VII8_9BACT|nr:hypothetical protein PEPS_30720 [Persicobacter psychrovividus]
MRKLSQSNYIGKALALLAALLIHGSLWAQEITDFYPKQTKETGAVTVIGSGLSAATGVTIDGQSSPYFKKISDTRLTFQVPKGVTTSTFTIEGINLTSSEAVKVNDFAGRTSFGVEAFSNTTNNGTDISDLGDGAPYTLSAVAGDGLEKFINNGNGHSSDAYQGGSGPNYLRLENNGGALFSGINTMGYGDIRIQFGFASWQNRNIDDVVELSFRDAANNGAWTSVDFPSFNNNNAHLWLYIVAGHGVNIPQTEQLEVKIMTKNPGNSCAMRIDDFEVTGRLLPPYVAFNQSEIVSSEDAGQVEIGVTLTKAVEADRTISLSANFDEAKYSLTDKNGTNAANTITIVAGENTGAAILHITDNDIADGTDEFTIQMLSADAPVEIANPSEVAVTVFDDDGPALIYALEADMEQITEGSDETITVTAKFTKEVTGDQEITFTLGERTHAREYTFGNEFKMMVADGTKEATAVFAVVDDELLEQPEQVMLSVESVTDGVSLGELIPSVGFMVYDDELPTVTIALDQEVVQEEASPEVTITVTAEIPVVEDQVISLDIAGEGIDENDYQITSSIGEVGVAEVLIRAGEQSGQATMTIIRDKVNEGNEQMLVGMASATSGIDTEREVVAAELLILDEFVLQYFIGPETNGWRENGSIDTYRNNGYFDLDYQYTGTAKIGKAAVSGGEQAFDSYVKFTGNDGTNNHTNTFIMPGINTTGHDDLKLGFLLRPEKAGNSATADFRVEYSLDGGSNYAVLDLAYDHSGDQVYEQMQIEGFLPQAENMTLRFTNLEDNSKNGWWMDDLSIYHHVERPSVVFSVDQTMVNEADSPTVTISATLKEALESDEYVFLKAPKGYHYAAEIDPSNGGATVKQVASTAEDFQISGTVIKIPAGELSASVSLQVLDDDKKEYDETIELEVDGTSAGLSDIVRPSRLSVQVYDNDWGGVGEFWLKETLNNYENLERNPWYEGPTFLNRENRPWSNMRDHMLRQHFWNASTIHTAAPHYITGNAKISCEAFLGGMSKEEHSDWNKGAEKYPGASGEHYFFFDHENDYVQIDLLRNYKANATLQFGLYRFENWASDGTEMKVEYQVNHDGQWREMTFDPLPNQQTWHLVTLNEDLPRSGTDILTVRFQVRGLKGSNIFKIDDIELVERKLEVTGLDSDYKKVGEQFVIQGRNFLNVSSVKIGEYTLAAEDYRTLDSKRIQVTVPEGLTVGGEVKVYAPHGVGIGPVFKLDDRALMTLKVTKDELQEATEEEAIITVETDKPVAEDSYVSIAILGNAADVRLSATEAFIPKGASVSEPVTINAVYDDHIFEIDNTITVQLSGVIEGPVDMGDQTTHAITIINEEKIRMRLRVTGEEYLYEDTRDELLVFATVPFPMTEDFDFTVGFEGDAVLGEDFEIIGGGETLRIAEGQMFSDTLHIKVINDGVEEEEFESLVVGTTFEDMGEVNIVAETFTHYIVDGTTPEPVEPPLDAEKLSHTLQISKQGNQLQISANTALQQLKIFGLSGQLLHQSKPQQKAVTIPWTATGVFVVHGFTADGVMTKRVFLQ